MKCDPEEILNGKLHFWGSEPFSKFEMNTINNMAANLCIHF